MIASQFTAAQWIVLIGTCCTGIGTIITAYAGIVRARKESRTEAEIACLERVKRYMLENETLSEENYALRRKSQEA